MRIFNAEVCNKNFSDAKININNTKVNTKNILDAYVCMKNHQLAILIL